MKLKLKEIKARLGILKTPNFSASFSASHPVNGVFYIVRFSDGLKGMVREKPDGTFDPQCSTAFKRYKGKIFVNFQDAVDALYNGLVVFGDPWKKF